MSVRKRTWTTKRGAAKEAWVVNYTDQKGKRRLKTFDRKKDADKFAATAHMEVREGVHVADSESITVAAAGKLWIVSAEASGLERSTVDQYRQHLNFHIAPFLGATLLSKLGLPMVRDFEDQLRANGRSAKMVRKVRTSLGSILADAQERGLVGRNVVRDLSRKRRKGREERLERRQKGRLEVGVDIPAPSEVKAILAALSGRWRPILVTAIFTGLRASELRGLRWSDVDFERRKIHVRQRADRFNQIGRPKSEASERTLPVPPIIVNTLREWRLASRENVAGLVFANGAGNVESLANIINRGLIPAQIAAGVVHEAGKAKYTGLHSLRHFYASWCINPKERGGLHLDPKAVQERLGHSSIVITMDTYGHLFPAIDDGAEMEEAERSLLG